MRSSPVEARRGSHVEVHAVLDRLALRHPLEEHPWPIAVAAMRADLEFHWSFGVAEGFERRLPGVEPVRRRLHAVTERGGPELRERARVGTVERHLHFSALLSTCQRAQTNSTPCARGSSVE